MPIVLEIDMRTTRLERFARQFPKQAAVALRAGYLDIAADFQAYMVKERLRKSGDPRVPHDPRQGLYRRTGRLARSLVFKSTGSIKDIDSVEVKIGWFSRKQSQIALVHEKGAKIKPKKSKFIAVPLFAAMTPSGVTRRSPREYNNTFLKPSPRGYVMFQKRGKQIIPIFALVRSVKIPPRLGFRASLQTRTAKNRRERILKARIRQAMLKARKG